MKKRVFTGTSGYNYEHWRGIFYPPELAKDKWLIFYTQHFNCVELNVTFYRLPSEKTFHNWYKNTPAYFRFVIKGSRFITHIKRLKNCKESLNIFFQRASLLKEKLLCILWQLPPSLKIDFARLRNFIKLLKKYPYFHSFEFRHQSWFNETIYNLLKKNKINLCIADSPRFPSQEVITTNFIYLRFHGGKILYGSNYSSEELKVWAKKTKKWLKDVNLLFAFFNNDAYGFAVKNAQEFKRLLEDESL